MSSTNRGSARNSDDFYATPAWCVDALLAYVGPLAGKRILEPSAGDGAIVRRLVAAGADPDFIAAVEQDPERSYALSVLARGTGMVVMCLDFMGIKTMYDFSAPETRFDMIVMNPPFNAAQAHIEKAISLLAPGGLCCALERLAFGASKKRAPFRAQHRYDKLELASRPSFTTGGTDSADYAWFCFGEWPEHSATPWPSARKCGGRFLVVEDGAR